jgi:hypothetical protein
MMMDRMYSSIIDPICNDNERMYCIYIWVLYLTIFELSGMLEPDYEEQVGVAIGELGLKSSGDQFDNEELGFILMEILRYPSLSKALQHHRANNLGSNDLLSRQAEIEEKVREKVHSLLMQIGCAGV